MRLSRFLKPFRLLSGRRFHGTLLDEKADRGTFGSERLLHVPSGSPVKPRDLFDGDGQVYLVATHGGERTFRVIEMDRQLGWKRHVRGRDPVTNLMRDNVEEDLGEIWCSLVPAGSISGAFPTDVPEYRLLTGVVLKIGDQVGPYTVARVDEMAGITVAEVR